MSDWADWNHPTLQRALAPVRNRVPLVVVLGLTATALEGFGIGMLVPLIGLASGGTESPVLPGPLRMLAEGLDPAAQAALIGATIFALIAAKNLVAWANAALQGYLYGRAGQSVRQQLADRLLGCEPAFCLTAPMGRLLNVVSNESWRAADAVAARLSLMVHLSATVILLLFLIALSPALTAIVALGLVLMHLAQERLTAHFRRLGREVITLNRGLADRMLHLIGAWRLIRLSAAEASESARFAEASDRVRRAGLRLDLRQSAVGPLIEVAYAGLFLAIVWVAWRLGTTFAEAAAFTILLYRMQPQVRGIQNARAALRGWSGALDEVAWLLDQPPRVRPENAVLQAPSLHKGIRFDGVGFAYAPDRRPALTEASFHLRPGEAVAIIGRSGSGKSTVANLLCGLIRPDRGRILVGETDLATVDPAAWLAEVAVASPELELFDGTVLDNIRYGQPTTTEAQAIEAARQAGADSFVARLPLGYHTPVGTRGTELSAGQRQRIALARAILRDPALLILDEATSAMDMLSEAHALDVLRRRRGRGISVVVTHHLSSIRACDRFLLFDGGRLMEEGPAGEVGPQEMQRLLRVVER